MGSTVEPKVFLIGESRVNQEGLDGLLAHLGVGDWKSDAPSEMELLCEVFGRACYRSFGTGLNPNVTRVRKTNVSYLKNIIEKGDGSVLEHGVVNFFIADASRVFTHELVRHRVGTAISQESLRFVRLTDLDWYAPCFYQRVAGGHGYIRSYIRGIGSTSTRIGRPLRDRREIVFRREEGDHFGS